jgi:hypothetical protein
MVWGRSRRSASVSQLPRPEATASRSPVRGSSTKSAVDGTRTGTTLLSSIRLAWTGST